MAASVTTPALAKDEQPCGADMICASDPATVVKAMEKAQLKPKLTKDKQGDPQIESDEAAYHFDVFFYGCEAGKQCDSLRFEAEFRKEPENTAELANKWNVGKRFLQAMVRENGQMSFGYDVSTVGGLNARNFADVLDWWVSMLDHLVTFFKETVPAKPAAEEVKTG